MTKKELITKLQVVADMGDKQIETIANLLVEFYTDPKTISGFEEEK